MTLRLTEEMRQALDECATGVVRVEDEASQKAYVLVEEDLHTRAMEALRSAEEDFAAIAAGVADIEAGRFRPLAAVDAQLRANHQIPHAT